jgi:hypothetical protein
MAGGAGTAGLFCDVAVSTKPADSRRRSAFLFINGVLMFFDRTRIR